MTIKSCLKNIFSLALFFPMVAFGQATVRGTITDSDKNEAMIGVSVMIAGTSLGAATDIEGQYRIIGIPEKVSTIKVSCVGYEPKEMEVDFSQQKEVTLNIQMKPMVIEGEEVIVTAQMRGQNAAMNQQITSNRIINVVSEEKIKELPDANAAEAIGRLPGVAIQRSGGEASKVVLRGMSSQYSNITIDGVAIPGTEQNRKEVDLSMIAQGTLSGIELSKTLLSDQDADAIAGAVNLVTRKAPSETEIKLELKGGYNHIMKSQDQYEISGAYATRFFNDILGLQIRISTEKKIRSRERVDYSYTTYYNDLLPLIPETGGFNDYEMSEVEVNFQDEIRARKNGQLILDVNTPDNGTIKVSGNYALTERNYMIYDRDYNSGRGLFNDYRYTQQALSTVNTALQGKNFLLGLDLDWGVSFAQSMAQNPFDFYMQFFDSPQVPRASSKFNPLAIIEPVPEDYIHLTCTTTAYYKRENLDKERTARLNIAKKYTISDLFSGEVKIGAKYKERERWMTNQEFNSNDYLNPMFYLHKDGTPKYYQDSRFKPYFDTGFPLLSLYYLIDYEPASRYLMNKYKMMPLISKDALREWYEMNWDGSTGASAQYASNGVSGLTEYSLKERVTSAFIMNTFNIGQVVTLITGVRVEKDVNDYTGKLFYGGIQNQGFQFNPIPDAKGRTIADSISRYVETMWLPNVQLAIRPMDFLTLRFAAYKAIARPDYNLRLPRFYRQARSYNLGNPSLKNMQAWNFEANTQIHTSSLGLISISAFFKKIDNLYHTINVFPLTGNSVDSLANYPAARFLDEVGSKWQYQPDFKNILMYTKEDYPSVAISIPYSSPDPSYAWGFEFEHQINFSSLPIAFLKNITLTYNISVTRSETNIYNSVAGDSVVLVSAHLTGFMPIYTYLPQMQYYELVKRQSENQPNVYGNASLGYDLGGFSARISVFYQDEYVRSYPGNVNKGITGYYDTFTKLDLTLKQKVSNYVSLYLNINNITNAEETTSSKSGAYGWVRPSSAELYGATADFGVILSL